MFKPIQVLSLGILAILFACTAQVEQTAEVETEAPKAPMRSSEKTKEVIEHHLSAFGQNDLQGVLSDYTDESIILTPDATIKGLAEIEPFFAGLFEGFPTDGTDFSLDKMTVENEIAYIIWHATTPSLDVPFGTDTFVVEDGKIVRQTFAGVINPVQ